MKRQALMGPITIAGLLMAASASAQTASDWTAVAAESRAAAAAGLAAWQSVDRDQIERSREAAERARDAAQRDRDSAQRGRDREVSQYDAGQSSLDAGKWDNAVQHFDAVIDMKGAKA